jgi:DNA-binding CsgD family transcriptional regulator
MLAMIEAGRGHEQARTHALTAIGEASALGARFVEAQGYSMLGLLDLGVGRPAAAIVPLQQCERIATELRLLELGYLQWAAELVEALVRSGRGKDVPPTLHTMRDATHSGTTTLNRALLARCEGIGTTDNTWEERFTSALALHTDAPTRPFELARTELCFGERLRRQRRRKDARIHLTIAWEIFSDLGAVTWAQRTSQELKATGTSALHPTTHRSDLLTPQELQVALAVSAGATNRQVAEALFLSQKTVEFHLSRIYGRLGLHSRSDLIRLLQERQRPPGSGRPSDKPTTVRR